MTKVVVVDYQIGNLFSLARALEKSGIEPIFSDEASVIRSADRLILPGVGAFEFCARMIAERDLVDPVREFVGTGRPFLGICVGMQLLFERSQEFGSHEGFGFLQGAIECIPTGDATRKVPHIGWNRLLLPARRSDWAGTVLEPLTPEHHSVYFVHSYAAQPADERVRLADVDYNGALISAAVQNEHILGMQFHPEKSGEVGLAILKRFAGI